ncbi:MAG: lecithin retinol acyltransferase family protein [Gammaproteobacteria bacterium]|nr:lecithin retinol acyltransferase family protein [Gammaproteobacteria bacterium]
MHSKLKMGDLLHRSKGIAQHAGVYMGNMQVLHNQPDRGTVITSFSEYAEGKEVKVVSTEATDMQQLAKRNEDIVSNKVQYQLFNNNCEHLANYLIFGRKMSPQIQATITGLISTALIRSQFKSGHWLLWLAGGALAGLAIHNVSRKYDFTIAPDTLQVAL